jgi:hypothetical protein
VPNETVTTTVVTPLPDTSEPTTEPSNPLTVVIAPSPSGSGEATTADLLERVRLLEEKLALTERTAEAAMTTAISADVTATLATLEPEPIAETTETMVIPESSDSGPPAKADPKPVEKKGFLHHWI